MSRGDDLLDDPDALADENEGPDDYCEDVEPDDDDDDEEDDDADEFTDVLTDPDLWP